MREFASPSSYAISNYGKRGGGRDEEVRLEANRLLATGWFDSCYCRYSRAGICAHHDPDLLKGRLNND